MLEKTKVVAAKAKKKIVAKSPELLIATGIVATVGGVVLACKATLKVNDILDEHKENVDKIHEASDKGKTADGAEYTERDAKKDTTTLYIQTGCKLAKNYAPAVIFVGAGIASFLASNNVLKKRNAALAAAYAAVDTAFKDYRARVIDRFGEEVDQQLRYNIKAVETEEEETDENGKTKKKKKKIETADASMYARYIRRGDHNWFNNPDSFKMFIEGQQSYLNDILHSRPLVSANGYNIMTLNEVYKSLGLSETLPGMVVGWMYDLKNPIGDNYIDISWQKVNIPDEDGGYEEAYLLDFNVDGNVYEFQTEKQGLHSRRSGNFFRDVYA